MAELVSQGMLLTPTSKEITSWSLAVLHGVVVLLEGNALVNRLECLVAQELGNHDTVGRVLMDTKLDALAELLIDFM